MKNKIIELILKRNRFIDIYYDSFDEITFEYTIEEPKEIDDIGDEIRTLIKSGIKTLDVDFILESLTTLGDAPQMMYDDNGHFAFSGDCLAPVTSDKFDENVQFTVFIEPDYWFDNIRDALEYYLKH